MICEFLFVFVGSIYSLQVSDSLLIFSVCVEISKLVRLTEMWQSMSYSLKWFYRFMQIFFFLLFNVLFCSCYCPRSAQKKTRNELFILNAICVRGRWTCVRELRLPNTVCVRERAAYWIKMNETNWYVCGFVYFWLKRDALRCFPLFLSGFTG